MTTIWHNPRCSKSRETLALLQENGIEAKVRLYLQDAPSEAEINAALSMLHLPAKSLIRSGDALFKELGLSTDLSDEGLVAAMAAHPALIERPVVFADGRAAIGRPPQAVLSLF